MTTQDKQAQQEDTGTGSGDQNQSNGSSDAGRKADKSQEHMIPLSRLNEVLETNKSLQKQIDEMNQTQNEAKRKQLEEQGKWQEIATELQGKVSVLDQTSKKLEQYEAVLKTTLEAQLQDIPPELRKLVPDKLTTAEQLEWISSNKKLLVKPDSYDIGTGRNFNNGGDQKKISLTAEQLQVAKSFGYTPEEYAKFMSEQQA